VQRQEMKQCQSRRKRHALHVHAANAGRVHRFRVL
jgi:hypothetical protein